MPNSLFLWGLLGLLQAVYLPGHLVTRALRLRPGIVDSLLLAFGLSTLVNYLLIQALVYCHIYTRPVMLGIIAAELLLAGLLWLRRTDHNQWQGSAETYHEAFTTWTGLPSPSRAIIVGIALLSVYCVGALAHSATAAWQDEAYTLWDNVMSWNRWATEWCTNKFPWKTYHYPQLLPANASIIYLLSGTTVVQAFSRLFFAFFPVAILLCLLDLGLRLRQIGFCLSIPLIYFAWIYMARPLPAEGYADVPVSFMILMAVFSCLTANLQRDPGRMVRWMLVAGVFAGAAMLTKQTGVYILITLPVFLAFLVQRRDLLTASQKRNAILYAFVLAFLLSVPWYIIKDIQIRAGADQSEIGPALTDAHAGRGILERMQFGIDQMYATWGSVQTATVATLAIIAALFRNPFTWVVRLIVIPGLLVWSMTTSYDLRNSNFGMVLGCAAAGVTLGHLLSTISNAWSSWPISLRCLTTTVTVVALVLALSFMSSVSNATLTARSIQTQKTTAMPELNARLFQLIGEHKITRPVITNYWMMFFIPGLKEFMTYDSLADSGAFTAAVARTNPEYIVILHPSQDYPTVSAKVVAEKIAKGLWAIDATGGAFQIIRINPIIVPPLETSPNFCGFRVVSGLAPEEGPYPQWNVPVVRWGLGPSTMLEFDAKQNEKYELAMEIENTATKLDVEIALNDVLVKSVPIPTEPGMKILRYTITTREGTNQLELRYSTWDAQSESRPLAVLYRSIRIALPSDSQ